MKINLDLNDLSTYDQDLLLNELNSSLEGLNNFQAQKRLTQYGTNEILRKPYHLIIIEAISHSINPLVAILFFAALISAFTGNLVNAAIIISIIIISIGLDYFQSHRALVAIKMLQKKIATTVTVLRENQWLDIPAKELVPGDLFRLSAGDMVPADSILLKSKDLHIHQAALTGESMPVEKEAIPLKAKPKNPLDALNVVFSGSSVIGGSATALAINTGSNSLYGHIAESLKKKPPHTEFEQGMMQFSTFIMKMVFLLVIFVFSINIYMHRPLLDSLLFAVALAVGLTPELLPMITTVTLASGAVRMSKKKVIIKNLSAIQNFGSIDILCSDKTGTLTSGEMNLTKYLDFSGKQSEFVMLLAYLNSVYITEIKSPFNIAVLKKARLNPLDLAILKHDHPDIQPYHKVDEIPFDFERRRSSVIVSKNENHLFICKGAPENIMSVCSYYDFAGERELFTEKEQKQCELLFQSLSNEGYRVLAIAYKLMDRQLKYTQSDEKEMIFAGFLAFTDPLLEDIPKVIKDLRHEGINIKILSGDNLIVTQHICQKVGMDTSRILTGEEISKISDDALPPLAEQIDIYARINPMQKQRIISALKKRGHVVGYLGDGINDVPSLHQADVGISVASAVDIAREAADIVLLEHHLKVLLNGIIEGRKSFRNVMKYLMMGTSSNFGNMISMAIAVLFLPFLPMLPRQILLNNLLYDISQITIPTDHVDPSSIHRYKRLDINIIRQFMFYVGPISSVFDFLTFFVMLKIFSANEALFQTGWFVESLATQTLVIFIIRTAKKPWQSMPSLPLTTTVLLIVMVGIWLPFSPFSRLFGFVPLPPLYFLFLVTATFTYLFLVELIKKKIMRKLY
ncbi:TPA: magnesium-translocating P-type ATPase [Legionella pneumophila subsp. pneumophila]|uniref:magnesium-translocating P-type ATPase n=1 Tax=Legionella pneumophila TaxID=446 RepID=UPI000770ABC6|nr:magnesium-translocating P-type ATPase [Legionella pneumophila]HAT9215201.1 magnesium-translocating P-type ATPase [Legionella pneumophila subsp. pneumophila]CZH38347.1 Magnesium-transporting ATPase%2C P-type 1 [Legionella pneumophila]CZI91510.1 Magnesium-transporting ATPase%2C P-type 1 [Legionella pneumophila]HAT9261290.1 magnesium-translocating P-type ATPase [Legionella pneumophila subsp. pneumophila]HAT9283226.1 magnesium-translocating P-type ATPase [Legionella pneumophila subsp. pneumophi